MGCGRLLGEHATPGCLGVQVRLTPQGIFLERELRVEDFCSGEVVFDGVTPRVLIADVLHWEKVRRVAVSRFDEVIVNGAWEERGEMFDQEGVVDDVFFGPLGWGEEKGLLEGRRFLN